MKALIIYLTVISILSLLLTIYDKLAAKAGVYRIPEAALLFFGAMGGAAAMYVAMLIIRHKTKKRKFMLTLPLFIICHIAIILYIYQAVTVL